MQTLPVKSAVENYRSPNVVADYARADTISDCERPLFEAFITEGCSVLDLGVGGGRTARHLAARAGRYLGIDYSPEMVEACRKRLPDLQFMVGDASRLNQIDDASFECVVFSFNGIDCFTRDEDRRACLNEVQRVLKPGGAFIFSSHNARFLFDPPNLAGARPHQVVWRTLRALRQAFGSAVSPSFIKGEGYVHEKVDGEMVLYRSTPAVIRRQIENAGMQVIAVELAHAPRITSAHATHWIYYACRKPER